MADQARSRRHDVGKYSIVVKGVVFRGDHVLLMKRSGYIPEKAGQWDIPGGVLRNEEAPVDGLKRETLEEAGMTIEVGTCLDCYWFGDVGDKTHVGLTYDARYASGELRGSAEHTEVSWYSLQSLPSDTPSWIAGLVQRASARRFPGETAETLRGTSAGTV